MHEVVLHEPYENPAISSDGKRVMRKINIGQYKSQPNHVKTTTGEIFYFASPEETPAKMHDLIQWQRSEEEKNELHPIELASQFHYKFIRIHPFDDGNGRMARILMNLILMRNGFPPVIVKTQDKDNYFKALQAADGGDVSFFEDYIADNAVHSLELFLRGAKGEDISELSDLYKEIALFKKENESDNLSNVVKRSDKIIRERYYDTFRPLFEKTIESLSIFNSLFSTVNISSSLGTEGKANKLGYLDTFFRNLSLRNHYVNEERDTMQDKISINYNLNGYKRAGLNTFFCSTQLQILFDQFTYKVANRDVEIPMKKLYSEKLTDTEINEIVSIITRTVFEYIKIQANRD